MPRQAVRLVLGLLGAGALSFAAGFALVEATARIPCRGEGLACNIDAAVGAYAVIIWALLGPLVFGVTLFVARNRKALFGAMAVLLAIPIAVLLLTQFEHTRYVGLEPERQLRTFLVSFAPPALAVLVQYLVLRLVVPRADAKA
ncbi:MAG: hypothetical protein AB7V40_11775 [Methyloceanibacter sp.]